MKPSIPKGMRDFSSQEMLRRRHIFDQIRKVFELHGFMPIETPSMENLSTLLGKYGDEGDKLLFKVLNSGDFLASLSAGDVEGANSAATSLKISEKGLRYDLTVPFARYVVQHQSDITFPFKRYQIQPVWRADRPQKGRYREFCQCDVDVVGSDSLLNEVELVQIVAEVFARLGIFVVLKINNRKILYGIAETIGQVDKMMDITLAIDKLEKIGLDAVKEELASKGLTQESIEALQPILELSGDNARKVESLRKVLSSSQIGLKGVDEVETVLNYCQSLGVAIDLEFDLSLARGLNYYTGAIFEVKAKDYAIGSICGGGRYDDLTGIFGLKGVSGVGISFGADRIYDVMVNLGLFPEETEVASSKVFFVNFGGEDERVALELMKKLRFSDISCEIYPDAVKMKKQMDYANKRGMPYVVIIGENERASRTASVKHMATGQQWSVSFDVLDSIFE
ncbi:MAG: histidine--tRNA ligase [Rikenellaceae bacterium]|nr:histidine--tRNA ligase [Rikenellaceae bacterium]